jgi:outer membrane protein assembly factor BamB
MKRLSAILLAALVFRPTLADESWPQFRGPTGQGIAAECVVPDHFDQHTGMRWRTEIDGKGWSSPVVADGKIWLTTAIERERVQVKVKGETKDVASGLNLKVLCLDFATGKPLREIDLAEIKEAQPIHALNTYASPTPVILGDKVICHFGTYGTWCLNASNGETVWKKQVIVDHSVGPGSSPIVQGKHLILVCDGIDSQFVVALNVDTGEEVWRTARPPMTANSDEMKKAYSTPIAIEVNGKTQIAAPGAQWVCSYDPETGKEIWRAKHGDGFSTSPSAVYWRGMVVFSTGFMRPEMVAVRADGAGDVTDTHIAWRVKRGAPNKPSPIVAGGNLYMLADSGIMTQVGPDGEEHWQERLGGNYSASLIASGDRIFVCSHEGIVTVVKAGDKYRELAKNELAGEGRLMASPAIVDGELLIRSETSLMRFGK